MNAHVTLSAKDFRLRVVERCHAAKVPDDAIPAIIAQCKTRSDADLSDAIINYLADQDPGEIRSQLPAHGGRHGEQAEAMTDAFYAQVSGSRPSSRAEDFMGMTMLEMGEALQLSAGLPVGRGSIHKRVDAVMNGMHTTSDFPNIAGIIGAGLERYMADVYQAASSPLLKLVKERNTSNLRGVSVGRVGEFPEMKDVVEAGELTYGTRGEVFESYGMKTAGVLFALSRKLMIDDDKNALADNVRNGGQSGATYVADKLAALFTANTKGGAKLSDNVNLFHASRGNLAGTPSTLDVASMTIARKALRQTKSIDGKTYLSITPKYLVVEPAFETLADALVAVITPATVDDANPFAGKLEVLCEPRLDGCGWYLFADPATAEVISASYLDGRRVPRLDQREGWNILGMEFRSVFDFGCGATGWRGAYRNAGA